jgi:hypothetical protein
VTGFGSDDFDSQLMNEFFSDSDHLGGSFVNASRSWSIVSSNLGPPEDHAGKRSSAQCSGDGRVVSCKTDDPDPLMTPSSGAESSGADQSWLPGPNFPGPNPQFGGAYLSALGLEMTAARNSFPIARLWDTTQGTFLPTSGAYDLSPPVVGDDFTGTSNVVSPTEPLGNSLGTISGPGTVPEIPTPAMLLIGLAGLALIGGRRLRGSGPAGSTVRTS